MGSMADDVICLGCGRMVGTSDGCACPPPSIAPSSRSASPYRGAIDTSPCPRCSGRLLEEEFHDVIALDCGACHGFFLDKPTIEKLGAPDGEALRLAFPKRDRRAEDRDVRYLACPVCHALMNRTVFARVSGVIVDVCKHHGVWFDCGEVNAIIEFVEKGGLERARAKAEAAHAAENAQLRSQFQEVHREVVRAEAMRWNHGSSQALYVQDLTTAFLTLFD